MKTSVPEPKCPDLPPGECCICHMKLVAPWGRNGPTGEEWTCGNTCQVAYYVKKDLSWKPR